MSLKKKAIKSAAYITHPKATFALLNPGKAVLMKGVEMAADRITGRPRRPSRMGMAARGLGAAALALPLGYWLGQKFSDRGTAETFTTA